MKTQKTSAYYSYIFLLTVSAKWYHFAFTSVKREYFSHLLKKIGSGALNSVKEWRHRKPPLWKEKALRMSYKTFSISGMQRVLSQQKIVE